MKNLNVCKFNQIRSGDLICENFIYETEDTQKETLTAKNFVLNLVCEGKGIVTCGEECFDVSAGDIFFVLKGESFSVSSAEGCELLYMYISFNGRRAYEYVERFGVGVNYRHFCGYEYLIPFWKESQEIAREENIDLLSEAVLVYSLARLTVEKKRNSDLISRMIELTNEYFTDPAFSVSALANELGYDKKYLSSVFKRKKGITYTNYLKGLRIRRAVFYMEEGVNSVKNAAFLSGFNDPLYFSKVFTAEIGITPKDFIKKVEQNGKK
ncbi:MAG: helix-turn-helix transcriptional regulator [Clostridia bacterium]|nr:helix-turn-helix transcriptional regulator [Clostridia bacterium]